MQKSYVVLKRVNLTFASFHIDKGDILVYDANNNNNLAVYRNQNLMKTTSHTPLGMAALVRAGMIEIIESQTNETPVADTDPTNLSLGQKIEEGAEVVALEADAAAQAAIAEAESLSAKVKAEAERVVASIKPETRTVEAETEKEVKAVTAATTAEETKVGTTTNTIVPIVETEVKTIETNADADVKKVETPVEGAAGTVVKSAEDLAALTKAQIVAHAAEIHGLELDVTQPKKELLAAINTVTTDVKTEETKVVGEIKSSIETKIIDEVKATI